MSLGDDRADARARPDDRHASRSSAPSRARRFDEHDLALAEDARAARGERGRQRAAATGTRSAIAQTLQASLLPPALPDIPGLELGAVYRAAGEGYEVGGDFYDLFSTSEGHWFAVIGDVQGKGAEAAAVTALARYTIRAAAVRRRSPAAILRWVSEVDAAPRGARRPLLHDRLRAPRRHRARRSASRWPAAGTRLPLVLRADGHVRRGRRAGDAARAWSNGPELEDRAADLRRRRHARALHRRPDRGRRAPGDVGPRRAGPRARRRCAAARRRRLADGLLKRAVPDTAGALRDDIAILALRADGES